MSTTKTLATFALVATQAVTAQADEDNGWFGGIGYEQDASTYTLTVPSTLFAPDNALPYLPSSVSMNINSRDCVTASAGRRWSGGNTNASGFSWKVTSALKASACRANIDVNLAPIKAHVIGRIGEEVYGTIRTTMDTHMPQEVLSFAGMYGVDMNGLMDQSASAASGYIMDPSTWLPTTSDVQLAFNQIPAVNNPAVNAVINDARDIALNTTSTVNGVRDAVNQIYALPDQVQGSGKMFALSFENTIEGRYHFSRQTYAFGGLDLNAVARASFHGQPFGAIAETPDIIVPFGGFEAAARLGVGFTDVFGDFDIAAIYNQPASKFWVPVEGATLEGTTKAFFSLEATNDNGTTFGVSYTPSATKEERQFGVFANLNF